MNIENIKRAIEHVKTLKPEQFTMQVYRKYGDGEYSNTVECGTVGCIVGHCTILDAENVKENFINFGILEFSKWSYNFFDIKKQEIWDYMFSDRWDYNDETNTIEHAVYRMQRIIDGYKPKRIAMEIINEMEKIKENESKKH